MSEREQVEVAKKKVLTVYPKFQVRHLYKPNDSQYRAFDGKNSKSKPIGPWCKTRNKAIIAAASRLPAPVSAAPAEAIVSHATFSKREIGGWFPTRHESPQAEPGEQECITNGNYCKTHDCFLATCKEFRSGKQSQPSTLPPSSPQAQRGPHLLTARDGSQEYCGGRGACEWCEKVAAQSQPVAEIADLVSDEDLQLGIDLYEDRPDCVEYRALKELQQRREADRQLLRKVQS